MKRSLLLFALVLALVSVSLGQQAGRPRRVLTKPGLPCNPRDFIQAVDTGVTSVCGPAGDVWDDLSGGGGGGGGAGDVVGPSSSTDTELPLFSGTGGKTLKRSNTLTGYLKLTSGVVSAAVIPESDLPSLINAAKIGDGSVSTSEFQFLNTVTSNVQTQIDGKPPSTRSISTTSPLTGGGDLSANRTFAINDAAADGATKGAASFTAADFNATTGNISLDYTNGQAASGSLKGFLTSTDWSTFNSKQAGPLTGDVTTSGAAATIANDAVTNAKAGNMAANTIKGRVTASTGDPEDLSATQAKTVIGLATISTDNAITRFDSTAGNTQNSGVTIDDGNNLSTPGSITSGAGGSAAGALDLGEGTAASLVANTFTIMSPTDVAAGGLAYVLPATAATGFLLATDSSGMMTLSHVAFSGTGNVARVTDTVFTSSLQVPNGAAPTTDAFGEIAGDNNAWATSRGAIQWFDGTANTYIVGVLASDTPSNGQVPTWNTGGTITWETPSGGGSSLPVADTTSVVKGSGDATKEVRFEVDGLTTSTVRVITAPDSNTTLPIISQLLTFTGPSAARTITLPDASITVARTDAGQTFTGVNTFTSPKILTDLSDTNGNELFKVTATGSAVNEFTVANAATGNAPTLSATGSDTNIDLRLTPKGAGAVVVNQAGSGTIALGSGGSYDAGFTRTAAGVIKTTNGSSGSGWIQNTSGSAFLTADATNATTTMANVSDLTITVTSGRKYAGKAILYFSDSVAADGAKMDFDGGTATMTNFRAHATAFDSALNLSTQTTAIATDVAAATFTGAGIFEIHFTLEPSASGTLIPRFAQNAHTTGTLTLARGSFLMIWDMP